MGSGVGSVAVVRALIAANDPEAEARRLSDAIRKLSHPMRAKKQAII